MKYKSYKDQGARVIELQRFRGVDFRSADTQVDISRSPDACNMMAGDNVYFPVKRPGYKCCVDSAFVGSPNGIFPYTREGVEHLLVHVGSHLLCYDCQDGEVENEVLISSELNDAPSDGFYLEGCFWLLDGRTFWRYDGEELTPASEYAYIPLTSIAREPLGGGRVLEAVNLLSGRRCNSFAADGVSKAFHLDAQALDADEVKVLADGVLLKEGEGFTVDRAAGVINFAAAPSKFSGVDNVTVEFCKTVEGYADRINRCRVAQMYGGRNDTRVFFTGNPDFPNCDWYSGLYDPTYFPDTGYTYIGSDASAIMGYAKQFDSLIVIKGESHTDAAMYLRTCSFDQNGEVVFPVLQGAAGDGCVSFASIAVYQDTPLYVSSGGVRAVVGTEVYEQRTIKSRSAYIDSRLMTQQLAESCGVVHEGRYYLCVDGVCYVADLRQMSADASSVDGSAQFEWYYFDNIPAKRLLSHGRYLWFLSEEGKLYRFYRSKEKGIYSDAGQPIRAWWTTPLLPLSGEMSEGTVRRVSLLLQPMQHSGCKVYVQSDGVGIDEEHAYVDRRYLDLIDFEDVDFGRFSFSALYQPAWEHFRLRRRKTRLFSLKIVSDGEGDGIGIYRIAVEVRLTQ